MKWDSWGGSTLILKGIKGESSLFFFTVVSVNMCSGNTLMSFFRILKLRTCSPSYILNGNL